MGLIRISFHNKMYYMHDQVVVRQYHQLQSFALSMKYHQKHMDHLLVIFTAGERRFLDLFRILLRFRTNSVRIVADIEKAFLIVGIVIKDRYALKLLWADDLYELD